MVYMNFETCFLFVVFLITFVLSSHNYVHVVEFFNQLCSLICGFIVNKILLNLMDMFK